MNASSSGSTRTCVDPSSIRRRARGGWHLYRCEPLGGSIPVDFRSMVGIDPDVAMSWLTSVTDGEVVYVAGLVVDAAGTDRGAAVWTASYRYDGPFHPAQAANDLAREVAANPDGVAPSPSSDAVQAAAACADDRPSA